jgi:hypothetical protein
LEDLSEETPLILGIHPSSITPSFLSGPIVTDWVKKGNTPIVLGINEPIGDIKFTTFIDTLCPY